jgi:hypothetical protein
MYKGQETDRNYIGNVKGVSRPTERKISDENLLLS